MKPVQFIFRLISRPPLVLAFFWVVMLLGACNTNPTVGTITKGSEQNLQQNMGYPSGGNALKVFEVAINNKTKRAYVHSIISSSIAEVDYENKKLLRYLESGLSGFHISYMGCDEVNNSLLIIDQLSKQLLKINVASNTIDTKAALSFSPSQIAVESSLGIFAISSASSNLINIYQTKDLKLLKSLSTADKVYGPMGLLWRDGYLYAIQGRAQKDTYAGSDSSTSSSVLMIDPSTYATTMTSVPYKGSSQGDVNLDGQQFFALSTTRIRQGSFQSSEYKSLSIASAENTMAFFNQPLQKVFILSRDGQNNDVTQAPFGNLAQYSATGLAKEKDIMLGMKPSRGAMTDDGRYFLTPNMAEGTLSVLDFEQDNKLSTVDLGSSLELVEVHPDGKKVYAISRLGGNAMYIYDQSRPTVIKTINLEPWPVAAQVDESSHRLYIYSHYHSTIEIFDMDADAKIGDIDLKSIGAVRSVSHFLSDLQINSFTHKAYVAIPEQGLIVEADLQTQQVTQKKVVFPAISEATETDDTEEVGFAQLATSGDDGMVFLYLRNDHKLQVLNSNAQFAVEQEITFSSTDFSSNFFESKLLFFDTTTSNLFVGPKVYHWSGSALTSVTELAGTSKVFGSKNGVIFSVTKNASGKIEVLAHKLTDSLYVLKLQQSIDESFTLAPRVVLWPKGDQIGLGFMESTKLPIYNFTLAP